MSAQEAKHTPWTAYKTEITGAGGTLVIAEFAVDVATSRKQAEAHTRISAAAPDMLAALREAEVNLVGAYGEPDPKGPRSLESLSGRRAILTVRAAITKATGQDT